MIAKYNLNVNYDMEHTVKPHFKVISVLVTLQLQFPRIVPDLIHV